jgi:hypothetical protein
MAEAALANMKTGADCGRDAVCGEDRLPVEADARQFPSLAVGLSTVPRLARLRRMGARHPVAARAGAQGAGTKRHAHRGDRRFAVGQDGPKRGQRGYDAGKKIKGRKRHIAVDTLRIHRIRAYNGQLDDVAVCTCGRVASV